MFDKQKIIAMTATLEEFVRVHQNIFIMPEALSGNVLSLLKRLNANVVGILTNAPVNPEQNIIQTPSGNYPLVNFQDLLSKLNPQTGIIISAAKSMPNPKFFPTFVIGEITISIPAFALTDEEAMAIYDRLTTLEISKRYQEDGVLTNVHNISMRFARGMSTFLPQHQSVKIQFMEKQFRIDPKYYFEDTGIVIQGPLELRDNYTITTAQLYREWYPNAPIVISTWKNEATDIFREECKKIGVVLLENDLPAESGYGHVNYQLESSLKGVEYIENNASVEFVIKCRTDQRIEKPDFLLYFKNLLKTFPPNGDKLKARMIILGNYYSTRWFPFHLNDFMNFGTLEDIKKYFSMPREKGSKKGFSHNYFKMERAVSKYGLQHDIKLLSDKKLLKFNRITSRLNDSCEMYLMRTFYQTYIEDIDTTKFLQAHLKFLRDYLILVDDATLLFDWPKYEVLFRYSVNNPYGFNYTCGIGFSEWLDIYLNYKDEDESN